MIRVNSQSCKGGVIYLLEQEYGMQLPRRMQIEFSQVIKAETDRSGLEVTATQIYGLLDREYLQANTPYALQKHRLQEEYGTCTLSTDVAVDGVLQTLEGSGSGPLKALVASLPMAVEIMDYTEHAIGSGSDAQAAAYIELRLPGQRPVFGVGVHSNITTASIHALFRGINRALASAQAAQQSA